jgi:hypothetical protein
MSFSLNGVGKTDAYVWRYDSTLLTKVLWGGEVSGAAGGGGSTQVAVSSLAGTVTTQPQSTVWAGNAGFHFDGSGNLNIAGSFSASTTVNVSSLAGKVSVEQNSTVWAVQLTQWSTTHNVSSLAGRVQVAPSDTNWASSAGFHFDGSGNLLTAGGAGGSSQVTISRVQDGADVGVFVGDSTNNAIRVNVVAGAAGGSTTVNVSSLAGKVTVDQNSTVWQVQVSSVAGVVNVQQNSTTWAVQLTQWSTTHNVSSLGGVVAVAQNSTVWQVQAAVKDSLGNLIESSTRAIGTNSTMRGLSVRSLMPDSTFVSGQASSAESQLITSAATQIFVYAYNLSPLSTGANLIRFLSGSTQELWRERLLGTSTQYPTPPTGLAMCVSPPAWLFRTAASQALLLSATSSGVNYSVSFWRE